MRLYVGNIPNTKGFAVCNVPKDHYFWALSSSSLTSDEPNFYKFIEEISKIYFSRPEYQIQINSIYSFLILIHSDMSADIYINNFPIEIKCRSKRTLKEGQIITDNDIADMRELRFPGIGIEESDSLICCLKVGWKFGLYFNFHDQNHELDIASVCTSLGRLYRHLTFQYVYQSFESGDYFEKMIEDGWFPFVEVLGDEYKELANVYQNDKFAYDDNVKVLLDKFDESRVQSVTEKWWEKPIFHGKQPLLQAGIDAFLQGGQSGYINCIKTLYTEIEGIMRSLCFIDGGENRPSTQQLINHLIAVGERTAEDDYSLLLPQQFLKYLTENVFKHFDLATSAVDLSRHSVSHGAAVGSDYTPERALQALLILDQIYFYLPVLPNEVEE